MGHCDVLCPLGGQFWIYFSGDVVFTFYFITDTACVINCWFTCSFLIRLFHMWCLTGLGPFRVDFSVIIDDVIFTFSDVLSYHWFDYFNCVCYWGRSFLISFFHMWCLTGLGPFRVDFSVIIDDVIFTFSDVLSYHWFAYFNCVCYWGRLGLLRANFIWGRFGEAVSVCIS